MDSAFDICLRSMNDGHFGIGGCATVEYHFDRTSVAVIGTLTCDRFELGAFRFLNAQVQDRVALANPNWTFEVPVGGLLSAIHARYFLAWTPTADLADCL